MVFTTILDTGDERSHGGSNGGLRAKWEWQRTNECTAIADPGQKQGDSELMSSLDFVFWAGET